MDHLTNLLPKTSSSETVPKFKLMNEAERLEMEINIYNESEGDLNIDGIDCTLCKNKGYVMKNKDGYKTLYPCNCMIGRRSKLLIQKSGLGKLLALYTMDTYQCSRSWQYDIKKLAMKYADDYKNKWFYIGGQVGCGKTHICTAMVSILIDKGVEIKYMVWKDEIKKIRMASFDDHPIDMIEKWKRVPILYIDDFFQSDSKPHTNEIDLAWEILNYRYNNHLSTIISTEYDIDVILSINEAVGSRIAEMTKGYCINISRDVTKNLRLSKEA